MKEKKTFVPIPNKMFAFDTNYFVTNEELVVFFQLSCLRLAKDYTLAITSVDLINNLIQFDLKNQSRGKQKIREALLSLHDKGYISLMFSDSSLKNNTLLEITIPTVDSPIYQEAVRSGNWSYQGFTEVTEKMYERAGTIEQFKVLIYVEWRSFKYSEKKQKYAITYSEWESVLGVSHQTAIKIIKECCVLGLIVKERGDYYTNSEGQPRQYPNKYAIKEQSAETCSDVIDINKEINVRFNIEKLKEKSKETRKHNWFTKDSKINENDIYVYKTTNCSQLMEYAKKRIDGICKTEGGEKMIDNFMEKAKQRIKQEKIERALQEERVKRELAEMEEQWEREKKQDSKPKQKKVKASYDISDFLDDEPIWKSESHDEFPMFR